VTTDGVVLVGDPDDEDDVEGGRRVLEELRHDGFHAFNKRESILSNNIAPLKQRCPSTCGYWSSNSMFFDNWVVNQFLDCNL